MLSSTIRTVASYRHLTQHETILYGYLFLWVSKFCRFHGSYPQKSQNFICIIFKVIKLYHKKIAPQSGLSCRNHENNKPSKCTTISPLLYLSKMLSHIKTTLNILRGGYDPVI